MQRSVTCIRHPTEDFVSTDTYEAIKDKICEERVVVLNVHGFPGSGKSELVLKLAESFPYFATDTLFVKYHIDCDNSDIVAEELKSVLYAMSENNLLKANVFHSAVSGLKNKITQEFVQLLIRADIPILIVIEDPPKEDLELLTDLFRSLAIAKGRTNCNYIHVYLTTRYKSDLAVSNLPYLDLHVNGLTFTEGLALLGLSPVDDHHIQATGNELKAAEEIFHNLSGSPLGLKVVRVYCRKLCLSYSDYLQIMNTQQTSSSNTTQEVSVYESPLQKDLYQRIIHLLQPDSDEDYLFWKTTTVLSLFNHIDIPQRLIGRITEKCNTRSAKGYDLSFKKMQNKLQSSRFISKCCNFGLCKVDGVGYFGKTITFHKVIFLAVRIFLNQRGILQSELELAVEVIASMVHKDTRHPEDYKLMKQLLPHARSVLRFVESHGEACDKFVFKQAVSHMYEVMSLFEADKSVVDAETALTKSLNIVWQACIKNQLNVNCLLQKQSEDVGEISRSVVKLCVDAGRELICQPHEFSQFASLLLQFKSDEVNFLTTLATETEVSQYVKDASEYCADIDAATLEKLRELEKGKMFLHFRTHCLIFYVERIASILHSLSYATQRGDPSTSTRKREASIWYCDMANALCVECFAQTTIKLLLLHVTSCSRISARLTGLSDLASDEKKRILLEARCLALRCRKQLLDGGDFYEHALAKCVRNHFDDMIALQPIVRIDTKLMSVCEDVERADMHDSDSYFEELYQAAICNPRAKISSESVVYCGKFCASKGLYKEAAGMFVKAFHMGGADANDPWVSYNYARAVVRGELLQDVDVAISKCVEALKLKFMDNCQSDLFDKLQNQLDLLQAIGLGKLLLAFVFLVFIFFIARLAKFISE